jgi:hypothetical protein
MFEGFMKYISRAYELHDLHKSEEKKQNFKKNGNENNENHDM